VRGRWSVLFEVTFFFLLVIGICRLLFQFRSVPFIARTLPLWAAGLFLYLPLFLLMVHKKAPRDWGLTLDRLRFSLLAALLMSLLCLPTFLVLYHVYQKVWLSVDGRIALSSSWGLLLLYHLACVALPEEVFYRGYMQSRLNEVFAARINLFSGRVGFGWLYTTALFALGHYLIDFRVNTLATFFPGLVFGWLRERTGSVVAPTIFHALCNGTVLLVS